MELPKAAGKVGVIEDDKVIYIEDYALQYIKVLRQKGFIKEDKYLLYGKKDKKSGKEWYIIYGICRLEEESRLWMKEDGNGYEWIGNVDTALWEREGSGCDGILVGTKEGGQPIKGYYIFYDADDKMKDCLSGYYEESMSRSRYIPQRETEIGTKAELVALSSKEQPAEVSLYLWIRIAAIGILVVFCAIAVTTINGYDKISNFVQAAVRTSEIMEEP